MLAQPYAQNGHKDKARELWREVQAAGGTDGAADLACLWGILAAR